jgi:HAD superfamily hydrolase (TIGR01509 family)
LTTVALRALLFDFDGLILDTETPELVSWQELWAEHGQRFPVEHFLSEIGTVGGYGAFPALEALTGPLDRAAVGARRSARKLALIEIEELRPGVIDYLEQARARGIATAIVSSSSRGWIDAHLSRLERAEQFDVIVTGDHDRERGKPLPTLYLEALAELGIGPGEAVAFEDSPNGIRAATSAAIFCVAVPNGVTASLALDEADLLVGSLAELPFERLLGWFGGAG